jgi:exonuclease III
MKLTQKNSEVIIMKDTNIIKERRDLKNKQKERDSLISKIIQNFKLKDMNNIPSYEYYEDFTDSELQKELYYIRDVIGCNHCLWYWEYYEPCKVCGKTKE